MTAHKPWTPMDELLLEALYPNTCAARLAELLGRPEHCVYKKARMMHLAKSEEFLSSPQSGRWNGSSGRDFRFKKGQTPWNKGKHVVAGGRSAETRFKKGTRPPNWMPIGSERTSQDGYRQRKMTDTGYPPRDWVSVHILLWTEHHGPVPPGHIVAFKDRNKQNIVIENLELRTLAENMRGNTIHRFPPELRDLIRLQGRVRKAIENRHEEQDH